MAGVGKTGPMAKRDAERVRRNVPAGGTHVEITPDQMDGLPFIIELLVEPPDPDPQWHNIATMVYEALLRDPARIWMGPADWAYCYLMTESLSRELKPQVVGIVEGGYDAETGETIAGHVAREIVPMKGNTLTAIQKWLQSLGVTEAARIGMGKEITFNQLPKATADPTEEEVAETREGFFVVPGEETA